MTAQRTAQIMLLGVVAFGALWWLARLAVEALS